VEVCRSVHFLTNTFLFNNRTITAISTPLVQVLIKPIERIAPSSADVNKASGGIFIHIYLYSFVSFREFPRFCLIIPPCAAVLQVLVFPQHIFRSTVFSAPFRSTVFATPFPQLFSQLYVL
jgi:hypothetical protein